MGGIKIVGIVGSPRKGNTEIMVFETLEGAKSKGAETEMILLRNKRVKLYRGSEVSTYEDEMQEISEKLEGADGIVIGSPSYFDNVPGLLKNFIDRTYPLYETEKLKDKFLVVTAVGEGGMQSINRVADYLKTFGEIHGMKFINSVTAIAGAPGSVRENENTIQELRQLGERMVEVIKKAKEVKKDAL